MTVLLEEYHKKRLIEEYNRIELECLDITDRFMKAKELHGYVYANDIYGVDKSRLRGELRGFKNALLFLGIDIVKLVDGHKK